MNLINSSRKELGWKS